MLSDSEKYTIYGWNIGKENIIVLTDSEKYTIYAWNIWIENIIVLTDSEKYTIYGLNLTFLLIVWNKPSLRHACFFVYF